MISSRLLILLFLLLGLGLAACSAQGAGTTSEGPLPQAQSAVGSPPNLSEFDNVLESGSSVVQSRAWKDDSPRADSQGAVVVEIKPINLNSPGETLDFEVSVNTHSVDLSMDLASLATLTTDRGLTVQALRWEAPRGGHHVSGILRFPALPEGEPAIADVNRLVLRLYNLDAPERIFEWER